MKVIKPSTIGLTDGSFSRASVGTFFDSNGNLQTAGTNQPRFNYNRLTGRFEGILIEASATNILLNSASLSTQTVTVVAQTYTLSFYGSGSISLSGVFSGNLSGNSNPKVRNSLTFVVPAGSLTLTVTGTVQLAQLEIGGKATSYISTTTTSQTRSADVTTGSNLIFSTATDPNPIYSSVTTYSLGQKVRFNNVAYESLQNSNLNKQPDLFPTFWLNLGYDNIHAIYDTSVSTPTTATTEMTFVTRLGNLDALAFINVECAILEVAACDAISGELFYNSTYGLTGGNVVDWYQYFFFDPLTKRTQIVATGIPSTYLNSLVTVRMKTSVGSTVSLGAFIAGMTTVIGQTQLGASAGIVDYSKKQTDEFGNFTFIERAFSKRLQASVYLSNAMMNTVQRFLTSIRATPVVWIASDDPTYEETLIIYGFFKDFNTVISYPNNSICDLEIEGLT